MKKRVVRQNGASESPTCLECTTTQKGKWDIASLDRKRSFRFGFVLKCYRHSIIRRIIFDAYLKKLPKKYFRLFIFYVNEKNKHGVIKVFVDQQ